MITTYHAHHTFEFYSATPTYPMMLPYQARMKRRRVTAAACRPAKRETRKQAYPRNRGSGTSRAAGTALLLKDLRALWSTAPTARIWRYEPLPRALLLLDGEDRQILADDHRSGRSLPRPARILSSNRVHGTKGVATMVFWCCRGFKASLARRHAVL